MSYYVEDSSGDWVDDFASNGAIIRMYDDDKLPDSVKDFMKKGEADKELGMKIIEDLKETKSERYQYILEMFESLESDQYPVIITDGLFG